jgi:formamidopyrimidine-DNA glycosylase
MPEAPEVEAVVQTLQPLVLGQTIRRCRVIHPIAVKPHAPTLLAKSLRENRIEEVTRIGKYLILRLARGILTFHFKFDGQILLFNAAPQRGVHVDVLLTLDKVTLGFVDQRHLGRMIWYESVAAAPSLNKLGVDIFSEEFTPAVLATALKNSRLAVKLLLTDQTKIAGLGNIYSSEALWHARLDPRRSANRLTSVETRRLHKAIVSTAHRALECCSNPPPDFHNPEWWFSDLTPILRVYGREGERCRRCGGLIKRIQQGGRSSFFCPRCQRYISVESNSE